MVSKLAKFSQNQMYNKIRKTKLRKVTKFQKSTANCLGVIKSNPNSPLPPVRIGLFDNFTIINPKPDPKPNPKFNPKPNPKPKTKPKMLFLTY